MNTNSLTAEREHLANLLEPVLVGAASRLLALCGQSLGISPTTADFEAEFQRACAATTSNLP